MPSEPPSETCSARIGAALFARAYVQVGLVGANVGFIQHGDALWVFLTGTAISLLWWINVTHAARMPGPWGAIPYALGAGCGTVSGMYVSGWLS